MSTKKVKRTYYNKKLGKMITKTYEYDMSRYTGRRKKSLLIVGKNGRIYEDRLKTVLAETDDIATKQDIKAIVKQSVRRNEKLSIKSLLSKASSNKIEKMFINAGYTEAEIIEELGVTAEDLYNEENWQNSTFNFGGKAYDFVFSYVGKVLIAR